MVFQVKTYSHLHDTKIQTDVFKIYVCLSFYLSRLILGTAEPVFMGLSLEDKRGCIFCSSFVRGSSVCKEEHHIG